MASELMTTTDWVAQLGRRRGRLWIVPEFKVVFVSVAKNACTTVKWVLADLAREDTSTFKSGLKAYTDDNSAVHNRRLHPNIPSANHLDPKIRAEIHPDNGWFVFGIVRDPRSRLFSAWQDKVLLQYPAYRRWASEPWYPERPGEDAETINKQFADFVRAASKPKKRFPPRQDTHFRPQTAGLLAGRIPYSKIYPIEQLGALHADLTRHVADLGWTEPLVFRRSNDTPLRPTAATYPRGIRRKVEEWYARDFAEFGEYFDFSLIKAEPEWTPAQLREVQIRAALHRRVGDVRTIAIDYRKRTVELKRPEPTAALARRLTRRIARGILRRVRRVAGRLVSAR